jgi:hypothetical protein
MRKYHHLGIPTIEKIKGEVHLKHLKIYVSGYKESPYHIEWMRYEPDAPYPELVKTIPHVAFEVDDLEQELQGKKVIIGPNSPSPGVGGRLNQSMKPTAPWRNKFSVFATTPCRGLSLSR